MLYVDANDSSLEPRREEKSLGYQYTIKLTSYLEKIDVFKRIKTTHFNAQKFYMMCIEFKKLQK